MKNSLRSLFLLHQTLQLALCIGPGSVLLASTKPRYSVGLPDGEAWFITPLLQRPMTATFTPLQPTLGIAHGDFKLGAAARPWKPISWSSRWTVLELTLLPEAVWNSVVSVATEDRRFVCATCFSTQRSHSVSLCGQRRRGWAIVAPSRFHFTITTLTDDRGSFSREDIWRSLNSSVRPFYCLFVYGDCMSVCSILYTCQQWVWLK